VAQLKNTIKGVYKGFFTELKLNGVGYRFLAYQNNTLKFKAGFCNDLEYRIPESIQVFIESPTSILLFSYDFDLLKQVSSKLKNFKKPDAYKGKGFSFSNEILSLKEVKKS
jgi:large subunit ribosomal protein L6